MEDQFYDARYESRKREQAQSMKEDYELSRKEARRDILYENYMGEPKSDSARQLIDVAVNLELALQRFRRGMREVNR